MQTFTHLDLLEITEKEAELKMLLSKKETKKPKESTIKNILSYSKALSIRKSKHLKHLELFLN